MSLSLLCGDTYQSQEGFAHGELAGMSPELPAGGLSYYSFKSSEKHCKTLGENAEMVTWVTECKDKVWVCKLM